MLTWRIWNGFPAPNCSQPRFRARDLHALYYSCVQSSNQLQSGSLAMYRDLLTGPIASRSNVWNVVSDITVDMPSCRRSFTADVFAKFAVPK